MVAFGTMQCAIQRFHIYDFYENIEDEQKSDMNDKHPNILGS